jgi:uncharacterized protein (TIGR00251 family)
VVRQKYNNVLCTKAGFNNFIKNEKMIFRVRVKPNAKIDSIIIKENNELEVRIAAPPVDGKANKHLIHYLSEIFNVSKSAVVILKGLNAPYKTVEIIAGENYLKAVLSTL